MAALENLDPAARLEAILDGQDIEPATRLEYFLKQAAAGGNGGAGGGTAFYINLLGLGPDETGRLDKTYNEIVTAITNEQAIMVKNSAVNYFYVLVSAFQSSQGECRVRLYDMSNQLLKVFVSDNADEQLVEEK